MANYSLSEVFAKLKSEVKNPEWLDCADFNLLKIYQHAFHKSILGKKAISRVVFNWPFFLQHVYYFLSRFRNNYSKNLQKIQAIAARKHVLYVGGNIVTSEDGKAISSNAHNLLKTLGKEKCCYIYNEVNRGIVETGQELNSTEVFNCGNYTPLDEDDISLIKSIRKTLQKSRQLYDTNPIIASNFEAQLQQFIDDYRSWKFVLKQIAPESVFFSPHYHNEGLILACKRLKIKAIEIQHGLISREDYYYSYPKEWSAICKKALFADEILVFGEFWKQELLIGFEYSPDQIKIIGKYQYHPPVSSHSISQFIDKYELHNKKIIAICSQTNSPQFYADYTRKLSSMLLQKYEDYVIVIKPHPRQAGMNVIEGCKELSNVRVTEKTENLMVLLSIAEIQISIYSTTFFDAIGSGTINFSLQSSADSSEYAKVMVEQGIAYALEADENPIEKVMDLNTTAPTLDANSVFAPYYHDFWKL